MFDQLANTTIATDITFIHINGTDKFTNIWWFDEFIETTDFTDITFDYITGTDRFSNI